MIIRECWLLLAVLTNLFSFIICFFIAPVTVNSRIVDYYVISTRQIEIMHASRSRVAPAGDPSGRSFNMPAHWGEILHARVRNIKIMESTNHILTMVMKRGQIHRLWIINFSQEPSQPSPSHVVPATIEADPPTSAWMWLALLHVGVAPTGLLLSTELPVHLSPVTETTV